MFDAFNVQVCVSRNGQAPNELCEDPKPASKTKPCNTRPCTFKWQTGKWSDCSVCPFKAIIQKRTVWCGHESRHWDEKPLRVDSDKCSDSDGMKPPIKRLCSIECTRKCGGNKRPTRTAHDFVEVFKSLNIIALEPKIINVPEAKLETRPRLSQNLSKPSIAPPSEIEKLFGNDNEVTTKSIKSPKMWKYFMVHPVMMRHNTKRIHRHVRKVRKGQVVVDKMSDGDVDPDFPIREQRVQPLSDSGFRMLGDKLNVSLTITHNRRVKFQTSFKSFSLSHSQQLGETLDVRHSKVVNGSAHEVKRKSRE